MPCSELRFFRSENSVPPKKSYSWRSNTRTSATEQNLTSPSNLKDSMPDSGETSPGFMGSHNTQANSRDENSRGVMEMSTAMNSTCVDMPLDFSLKKTSNNQVSSPSPHSIQAERPPVCNTLSAVNMSSRDHKLPMLNGGSKLEDLSSQFYRKVCIPKENGISPKKDTKRDLFEENVSPQQLLTLPKPDPALNSSYSSPSCSPNSPSSSILKERLTRDSPGVVPVNTYSSAQLAALQAQNAFTNGFGTVFPQANIFNGVLTDPPIFPPSDILAQSPNMAFMGPQINMLATLPPIPPPSNFEIKAPTSRKLKQDRPFKSYPLTIQEDYPLPFQFGIQPPAIEGNVVLEPQPSGSRCVPQQRSSPNNVSINTNVSSNSDSMDVVNDVDSNHNVPHSSVPNSSLSETGEMVDSNGRKRKPVADAEKDENYWKKREKNNLAAKRSREARRKKEDLIAQHAAHYRSQAYFWKEQARTMAIQLQEFKVKTTALENNYMNIVAEIRLLRQAAAQNRCDQCGNRFSD